MTNLFLHIVYMDFLGRRLENIKIDEHQNFIEKHNLVNRIYDMSLFLGMIKSRSNEIEIKNFFSQQLSNVEYVESLAKYFEEKRKKFPDRIDLNCNLREIVYDLNYLKQYLK